MAHNNFNLHPSLNGAADLPTVDPDKECEKSRSEAQAPHSLATNPNPWRPLTSVGGDLNSDRPSSADRRSLLPNGLQPATALQADDLTVVDSEDLIREILRRVGEDPDREGLQETPARIVRSWKEIYGGYQQRSEDILLTQFRAEQYDEMILLQDIEFCSTCEHHMLPFYGKAHIGYFPNQRIVGLSKLARLLDIYARRLQVQERMTYQIAAELQRVLNPKGVAVMIEARHQCMCCRGVRKREGKMVTSCMLGAFKENLATRSEFLALVSRS